MIRGVLLAILNEKLNEFLALIFQFTKNQNLPGSFVIRHAVFPIGNYDSKTAIEFSDLFAIIVRE
jgi:hypothetical protein